MTLSRFLALSALLVALVAAGLLLAGCADRERLRQCEALIPKCDSIMTMQEEKIDQLRTRIGLCDSLNTQLQTEKIERLYPQPKPTKKKYQGDPYQKEKS